MHTQGAPVCESLQISPPHSHDPTPPLAAEHDSTPQEPRCSFQSLTAAIFLCASTLRHSSISWQAGGAGECGPSRGGSCPAHETPHPYNSMQRCLPRSGTDHTATSVLCVHSFARVCPCACVPAHAYGCVHVCACVRACVHGCVLVYPQEAVRQVSSHRGTICAAKAPECAHPHCPSACPLAQLPRAMHRLRPLLHAGACGQTAVHTRLGRKLPDAQAPEAIHTAAGLRHEDCRGHGANRQFCLLRLRLRPRRRCRPHTALQPGNCVKAAPVPAVKLQQVLRRPRVHAPLR